MSKKDTKVLLTAEGLQKLKVEYDELVNVKRKEVTEKILATKKLKR